MAVMTSHPESTTALTEKSQSQSLNMATSTSPAPIGDKRNGDAAEVNGHASPAESQPDKRPETDVDNHDNAPSQGQLKDTEASNKDAFVSNQSISAMTPPGTEGVAVKESEAVGDSEPASAQPDLVDTEMTDAPVESAKPPSPPAEPIADTSATAVETTGEDSKVESTSQKSALSPAATESVAKPEPESEETGTKPDAPAVEVKSGEKVEESQPPTANGEQSGDTAPEAAKTENPGDLISPTVSMSKMGLDASQDDATAPATADTSMTDAPSQSSTKVAREREDDDGEPAAKRTKVAGDQAADTPPKPSNEPASEDAMAVDQPSDAPAPAASAPSDATPSQTAAPATKATPAGSPVPLSVDGKARFLNDRALDDNPITSYQNREIRKVLGLVKKTKSGQHFRQPVQVLWPTVWEQYRQLIDRPVDISFIEQNLREGRYASIGAFRKDVKLLELNATTFNGAQHDVTNWAKSTVAQIDERLAAISAEEPQKPAKQEPKQMPTRHAEPRNPPPPPKAKEPRPTPTAPAEKASDGQIYALLPSGIPNIRRDSTKTDSDRPKRPIHPPKNKDLGMAPKSGKNKKKPELRFCEEVLKEVMHSKNWQQNQWFTTPVDPVALNIPTYHSVIKQPMDLGTMNEKLQRGEYESAKDFKSDFNLIVKNCVKFNGDVHPVTDAVKQLEALFEKKWSEKASWMSKNAQSPARAATSPRANAKEEADTDASEPEQDQGDELKEALRAVNAVTERLKQEQAELDKKLYSDDPDMSAIETHRTIINFLTTEMVNKRQALNKLQENKKPAQPKTSNKKKGSGGGGGGGGASGGGGAGGASKKSSQGGAGGSKKSGGGSTAKKSGPKKLTDEEKEIVSEAIGRLDGPLLERAIWIIKKDAKLEATDDDELELDMDQLSDIALVKLYDLVLKQFPEYRAQLKKNNPAPASSAGAQSSKPKKNKPMGKDEQERKLQQLRELKDSYKRPGSGSQEPLPSVENNDNLAGGDGDETDASSSEEE